MELWQLIGLWISFSVFALAALGLLIAGAKALWNWLIDWEE